MKIRTFIKSAFLFNIFMGINCLPQYAGLSKNIQVPTGFDLPAAMSLLFGNYNAMTSTSSYTIPQTTALDLKGSFFKIGDKTIVRPSWVSSVEEGGKRKIVVLTYAVPDQEPITPSNETPDSFDCPPCSPLMGVAIFVHDRDAWKIESSNTMVSPLGGFGQPLKYVKIVKIGLHRIGIEFFDGSIGQGETTLSKWLLVPWKNGVNIALTRVISDDNRGGCGKYAGGLPCYANKRSLVFIPGSNPEYYDIVLTLTGTDLSDGKPLRLKKVNGFEKLSFIDGIYKTVQKTGDNITADQ